MAGSPHPDNGSGAVIISALLGSGGLAAIVRVTAPVIREWRENRRQIDAKRDEDLKKANERLVAMLEQRIVALEEDLDHEREARRKDVENLRDVHSAQMKSLEERHTDQMSRQEERHQKEIGRSQAAHRECEERCKAFELRLARLERFNQAQQKPPEG